MDECLRLWGRNLRKRREDLKLTQEDVSKRLEPPVNVNTVARWEKGYMEPCRDRRAQLVEILEAKQEDLFPLVRVEPEPEPEPA